MKKIFLVSLLMSLILFIVPFFLFSFEVESDEHGESIVKQTNYSDYEDSKPEGNDSYTNEENDQDNLIYDKYYYESN